MRRSRVNEARSSRSRHVLLLSVVFPPDNVSTAHQVDYLARDLEALGYRVTVVTTRPHSRPEAQPVMPSDRRSMRIVRIPVFRKSRSALLNALIWMLFLVGSLVCGVLGTTKVDIVIAVTPPPGIGLVGALVARRHRAHLLYNVKELFPDVAVALRLFDQAFITRSLKWIEDRAFSLSDAVVTVVDGQKAAIARRVPGVRCLTIPDCVDVDTIVPGIDGSSFRAEWGLTTQILVTYAGNLGVPQNIDLLIDASSLLRDLEPLRIVIIGDGTERARLAARIEADGLDNVVLIPQQPFWRVPEIYAASDLVYVPLAASLGAEAMPSKAYQALAAEKPIVAAASPESSVISLVRSSGAGFEVAELTPRGVADAIRTAVCNSHDLERMGRLGRQYILDRYSRRVVSRDYAKLIDSLMEPR